MNEIFAPAVSVVTVFYNRSSTIAESIGSLCAQTLRDIEIIVIDDGSTDGSEYHFAQLRDERLRVVRQENAGFTVTINRAVRMARAPYVAIHGAGDISFPRRLEAQSMYLDANPPVGAVGCVREAEGFLRGSTDQVKRGPMFQVMLGKNPFSHGEVMFRRELFDRVGGYREMFRFAQDRDLWLRMGRHCEYAVLPELLYRRYYLPGGVTKTPRSLYLQTKLSQFAVQCAQQVDDQGRDLLDRLGPSAFFLVRPTKSLSRKYGLWGLRALRDDDAEAAETFLTAAWREHRNPYTLAAMIAHRMSRIGAIRGLVRRALRLVTPDRGPGESDEPAEPATRVERPVLVARS